MELEDETEMLVAEIAQFLGAEAAYIDAINHDAATIRLVEGTPVPSMSLPPTIAYLVDMVPPYGSI